MPYIMQKQQFDCNPQTPACSGISVWYWNPTSDLKMQKKPTYKLLYTTINMLRLTLTWAISFLSVNLTHVPNSHFKPFSSSGQRRLLNESKRRDF